MVRFGTKRVETSPPFSILRQKKALKPKGPRASIHLSDFYLFALYNAATFSQLITLKNAFM